MLQPKLLRPWKNSKYQVKHFDRRLFHREGGTHSFRAQCSMRGAVCQSICSCLEDSWGGLDGSTIDYTFHHNTSCNACHVDLYYCFISEKKASTSILCNASAITDACRDLVLCNNRSGMFWVCSLECLLSTTIPESQDSVLGPFSKKMGCAKAVLGVHALQLSSRSDENRRFARQPLMRDLVMLSLKLCNTNCLDSRWTQKKMLRSLTILKTCKASSRRAIWEIVCMEGLSDSSFGTVCLFLFVDCFSWPNLTAACAAQVAKQGVLSSFRHGYTFWRGRCRFRNRGLVTILVHLYLYNLDMILYASQLFQNNQIPASFLCQYSMT